MTKKKSKTSNWVKTVTTDTVNVPPGTLTKTPREIAKILLKKNTYPGCHGSINRFLQYYLNRGGKNITEERYKNIRAAMEIIRRKKK